MTTGTDTGAAMLIDAIMPPSFEGIVMASMLDDAGTPLICRLYEPVHRDGIGTLFFPARAGDEAAGRCGSIPQKAGLYLHRSSGHPAASISMQGTLRRLPCIAETQHLYDRIDELVFSPAIDFSNVLILQFVAEKGIYHQGYERLAFAP